MFKYGLNHPRPSCENITPVMIYDYQIFVGFTAEPLACGNQSTYNRVAKTVKTNNITHAPLNIVERRIMKLF